MTICDFCKKESTEASGVHRSCVDMMQEALGLLSGILGEECVSFSSYDYWFDKLLPRMIEAGIEEYDDWEYQIKKNAST